jgi:hypothetical protein
MQGKTKDGEIDDAETFSDLHFVLTKVGMCLIVNIKYLTADTFGNNAETTYVELWPFNAVNLTLIITL